MLSTVIVVPLCAIPVLYFLTFFDISFKGFAHTPYEWAPNSVDIQMLRVGNFGESLLITVRISSFWDTPGPPSRGVVVHWMAFLLYSHDIHLAGVPNLVSDSVELALECGVLRIIELTISVAYARSNVDNAGCVNSTPPVAFQFVINFI